MVALVRFYQGSINIEKNGNTAKGKIRQHFQGCLRPSCVRRVYFLRKSTEFHDVRTECQRKSIIIHFLLYSLFRSLPDHLRPNLLAHRSLFAPRSLAPNHSPIARSPTSDSFFEGGEPTLRPNAYPKKTHFPTSNPTTSSTKNPTTNPTSSLQQQQTPSWDNSGTAPPISSGSDAGEEVLKDYEGVYPPPRTTPSTTSPLWRTRFSGRVRGRSRRWTQENWSRGCSSTQPRRRILVRCLRPHCPGGDVGTAGIG